MSKTKKSELTEDCKKRKSDNLKYKIKDQLILYIIPILVAIAAYFLVNFFTGQGIDVEKNASAHEQFQNKDVELSKKIDAVEINNKFIIENLKEFKTDISKKLDRIERKLDK